MRLHRDFSSAAPVRPSGPCDRSRTLRLGDAVFNVETRALLMGILNRTPDSFFDRGRYFEMESFLARADQLVNEGADILDVGGVKAGPGPEVSVEEEMDRVVPAIEALRARFDVPISVDTWSARVASEAFSAGAVLGNDISGFSDPDYLDVAAIAGASVVATHIRLAPRVPDPDPVYDDLITEVEAFLARRVEDAKKRGITSDRIVIDAGLDLGKTAEQSLELLCASKRLASLGSTLLLSASNKTFLGVLGSLELTDRREASLAAAALGISLGCRIVRVHDVDGTRRVRDILAAVLEAG